MRRSRGVVALFCSVLLGLALVAAAGPDPGRGSEVGGRRVGAAPRVAVIDTAPDLGKRWVGAPPSGAAQVPAPLLGKRWS